MSDLITTVYPTAELTSKAYSTIYPALETAFKNCTQLADFFTISSSVSDTNGGNFMGVFLKHGSTVKIKINQSEKSDTAPAYSTSLTLRIMSQCDDGTHTGSYVSNVVSNTIASDIPVRFATGINGTNAMWLDDYSKGVVLVYGTHGGLDLVMSSAAADDISFYIANTDASTAKSLPMPCNGDLIGTGNPFICQPYYWNGINTGDIYTFDCGSDSIPFGEFWVGDKHFVSLYSNFALRLE